MSLSSDGYPQKVAARVFFGLVWLAVDIVSGVWEVYIELL